MSSVTLSDAALMLREAIKDKQYRSTPLGLEVARYIRWKRNEWGATTETIRDYESILAKLCLFFADLQLTDLETPVGTERLRECWDYHWGQRTARTRAKVRSVWVDFFDWAVREQRGLHGNAARALASPKRRGVKREPFGGNLVQKVISGQGYLPDKLAVILIVQYALRRAELASVRFRDFDFERRQLTIVGKGGKVRVVPIVDESFWRDLGATEISLGGPDIARDLYLVAKRRKVGMRVVFWHHRALVPRSVHTWWYNRLEEAGVTDEENRRGFGMHRGRHTVATEILRQTGNLVAAKELLGHSDISTTEEAYASFDTADLARVLLSFRGDGESTDE
jgi:site-specific recombinase XerC